jgi:hypothetical protein
VSCRSFPRHHEAAGNVKCTAGACGLVPAAAVGVQNATWDQKLPTFTFQSATYESATLTIPEFIIPDSLGDVYSGEGVPTSAAAASVECGSLATITCDEN